MIKKKYSQKKITSLARALFVFTFAALSVLGLSPQKSNHEYTFKENSSPVISRVIDTRSIPTAASSNSFGFPETSAQAHCLISADTGEILCEKNADTPLPMASTTKIMTALVAIESCDTDMLFTIPEEVCGTEGSSIYLCAGEKLTVKDLLYGLLLESGNDAACALAFATSGNIEDFVSLMNRKARELGLVNTSFANPHGLSAENHYTTARELAKISYAAMQNPLFREIVKTKYYIVKGENGEPLKYFFNHNKLLSSYEGAVGIKTGYTIASGRCLVTSAARNGTAFIAVTLNDRQDFSDHKAMLDFAFESFEAVTFAEKSSFGGIFGGCKYTNRDPVKVLHPKKNGNGTYSASVTLGKMSDFNNN